MNSIHYQKDSNNIAHLILDKANSTVNLMDIDFANDFTEAVDKVLSDEVDGVLIRSNKSTFMAGGDINLLFKTNDDNAHQLYAMLTQIKAAMRRLETSGKPIVACINGSALGGGFEVALCAHRRIAVKNKATQLGFPEVNLGLLPGAGGVVRMVRLLGLQAAMPYLTQAKLLNAERGLQAGLLHQVVDTAEQAIEAAIEWIKTNPQISQPYDHLGYLIPGGGPGHPAMTQVLPLAPVLINNATKGTLPAPQAILAAMVEGAQVDFDSACRIESRYFVELARGQTSKNLINTLWYQQNEIKAGLNRPKHFATTLFSKIGVLGAGMMGAGIAYSCAIKGLQVILKDVTLEAAEKGKDYSRGLLQKQLQQGRINDERLQATLALIHTTATVADLAGCELVIEAVFEDRKLKAKVTAETEAVLAESAVFGSNTSTLPITGLAQASKSPQNFIGIHFFSPVDKMPLVEIICASQTSDETLARAYDLVQQIGKTPIVVNDSRGFYTSRVFSTFVKEGVCMLAETDAAMIENAAWLNGFPVGPLAVTDEVSLTLIDKIQLQTQKDLAAEGKEPQSHPADAIISAMLQQQRSGKLTGKGFYDYPKGAAKHLWPQLAEQFRSQDTGIPLTDVGDRLLFIMALETVRCYEEQVLRSVGDANIGSIMGIGFPLWTGGTLQFINQYGVARFVKRAEQLAECYGSRFMPTDRLRAMARSGETY
jgi:3-hydroxyacyl-CoA dehydrogenase / enoyl-CoA hydratase / 3-hydroxybutyryl-CoA epimerase